MKIIQSSNISAFGGLNFVIKEAIDLKIKELLIEELPKLPSQSKYNWFDVIMSYWSVFFCGGDCAEDLNINLKDNLKNNPFIEIPSPDRLLERIKGLSDIPQYYTAERGKKKHQFSLAEKMNKLNLKMLTKLPGFRKDDVILDYDNTLIFTAKADARKSYQKETGYYPGVGIVGEHIVYVENRNGDSTAHVMQHQTIDRMVNMLNQNGITIDAIRADSASFTYEIIKSMEKATKRIFVRARMSATLENAISKITDWKEITTNSTKLLRGATTFIPFERHARGNKRKTESLKRYRLIVTKEVRRDGQINVFTGEAYNYSMIMTNDMEMTNDQVVMFYNARGASEREFDILKNDFGWNRLPFSKLEQNAVYLLMMAMCRNLYTHTIEKFSKMVSFLSPKFRIKKFIFRFICIPAKWVRSARINKLKLYGKINFVT
ncbi:IS1380 family transposase [Flavobacterium faecale]|uniref:IS1380 family transposase n=1 Tax=Flavobacterium faecale TaxID=1355330 RepID=UPI003AAE20F5